MRASLTAAVVASIIGFSSHGVAQAMARRATTIAPQELAPALHALMKQREFQIVYSSELLVNHQSHGASGELTMDEALAQILAGTGLTFRYLDEQTITILPGSAPRPSAEKTSANRQERERSLRFAQSAAVAAPGGVAQEVASSADGAAADAATQESEPADLRGMPEVLVEGSRSFNVDLVRSTDDAQPYHIIDSKVLEQSAAVNVSDFLKQHLTMNTTARDPSQQTGQFFTGSAINLRGLGALQTLILVDGRRTIGPTIGNSVFQFDLNSIPISAIERIEVLPVSASAIYGGSAMGGVVNVVTKHAYDGGELRVSYDNSFDTDSAVRTIDLSRGFTLEDGKTNILVAGHYSDAGALLSGDRPEFREAGIATILRNNPSLIASGASPFATGNATNIASMTGENLVLLDNTSLGSSFTYVPAGFSPGSSPALLAANAGSYNYDLPDSANNSGLGNILTSSPTVKSFLFKVRREMTESLEMFTEYFQGSSGSQSKSGAFQFDSIYTVPAGAPNNPFQQAVRVSVPYTTPLWTPYTTKSMVKRAVVGAIYRLPHRWVAEADYTWNWSYMRYAHDSSIAFGAGTRVTQAFADGTLNPFVDTSLYPLNLAPYLGTASHKGHSGVDDFALRLSGPFWELPGGTPTLSVALEHRKEAKGSYPFTFVYPNHPEDNVFIVRPPSSQSIDSIYAETFLPLVGSGNPLPGLRSLDLQIAARHEKYSVHTGVGSIVTTGDGDPVINGTAGSTGYSSTNPTIGLRYKPFDGVMLRASFASAFLPPTFNQLSPGIPGAVQTVIDPLRGNTATTIDVMLGGNPDLKPTSADNWNFGVVFEPAAIEGLRLDVEWYRITQDDVILAFTSSQQVVNNESTFPGRVVRAPVAPGDPYGVGAITLVNYTAANVAKGRTRGMDISLQYHRQAGALGEFGFATTWTRVSQYEQQTAVNSEFIDLLNQVGNSGPLKSKLSASLDWQRGAWMAGWASSYFGSYDQVVLGGSTAFVDAQGGAKVPSQLYHNVVVGYDFDKRSGGNADQGMLSGLSAQLGVKNVFNHVPPIDVYYSPYYYSPFGDPRLRSYWLSLAKKF